MRAYKSGVVPLRDKTASQRRVGSLKCSCARVCSLFNRNRELRVVYATVVSFFARTALFRQATKQRPAAKYWDLGVIRPFHRLPTKLPNENDHTARRMLDPVPSRGSVTCL